MILLVSISLDLEVLIYWEGFTQASQPFELTARYIDPFALPEYRNIAVSNPPAPPNHSSPHPNTIVYTGPSTLNAHAPPIYPLFHNNTQHIPHNSYSYHHPYTLQQTPPVTFQPSHNLISSSLITHTRVGDDSNQGRPSNQPNYKVPKLDFPKFDGKDPCGWIGKCEKFYQLHPTTDLRSRVLCAALHMEGEADIGVSNVRSTIYFGQNSLLWYARDLPKQGMKIWSANSIN